MAKLIKLAKMAGVMNEVDHTYYLECLVIALISYQCTIHSLCNKFALYFYPLLGIVEVLVLFYDLDCMFEC